MFKTIGILISNFTPFILKARPINNEDISFVLGIFEIPDLFCLHITFKNNLNLKDSFENVNEFIEFIRIAINQKQYFLSYSKTTANIRLKGKIKEDKNFSFLLKLESTCKCKKSNILQISNEIKKLRKKQNDLENKFLNSTKITIKESNPIYSFLKLKKYSYIFLGSKNELHLYFYDQSSISNSTCHDSFKKKASFDIHSSWIKKIVTNKQETLIITGSSDSLIKLFDFKINQGEFNEEFPELNLIYVYDYHHYAITDLYLRFNTTLCLYSVSYNGVVIQKEVEKESRAKKLFSFESEVVTMLVVKERIYVGGLYGDISWIELIESKIGENSTFTKNKIKAHNSIIRKIIKYNKNSIFSSSDDGSIKLWEFDNTTLNNKLILNCHQNWVNTIVFDKSRSLLASGSKDQKILIFSLQSMNMLNGYDPIFIFNTNSWIWNIAFLENTLFYSTSDLEINFIPNFI